MCCSEDRFLRLHEVLRLTGLSRSSLYRKVSAGEFPASVNLAERVVAWRYRDVKGWMDSRK